MNEMNISMAYAPSAEVLEWVAPAMISKTARSRLSAVRAKTITVRGRSEETNSLNPERPAYRKRKRKSNTTRHIATTARNQKLIDVAVEMLKKRSTGIA